MVIGMAVAAAAVFQSVCVFGFMTGAADDPPVFSLQPEISLVVIEVLYAFDAAERLLGVALRAILPELVVMNIFVTIGAIAESDPFEFLEFLFILYYRPVAGNAGNIPVPAHQLELCSSMIEVYSRFKCISPMTIGTTGRQGLLVVVGMACQARWFQAQVGEIFLFYRRVLYKISFVAIAAFFFCVGPG